MSTTRGSIRLEAAKLVGLWLGSGTATGGSTTTLVNTSTSDNGLLDSSLDATQRFKGGYVLMTGGTAGNIGQWREISDDAPASGTLTVAKAFPNAVAAGDTYEMYGSITPGQWSLDDTNSLIDIGLTRTRYLTASPLTLVTDGDMETSGVTNWTASNATLSKSTTDGVTFGAQSLKVSNTSGNGYAQSASVNVNPSQAYNFWISFRCDSAQADTAGVLVWDVTNNSQIGSTFTGVDSGVNYEGSTIYGSFSAGSTTRQVAFRLRGTEAGAVIYWDDLIMQSPVRRRYSAPSWILTRNQYMTLVQRNGQRPFEFYWTEAGNPKKVEEDPTAVVAFMVNLPELASDRPVYLEGERAYGPMSATADSTTTACNLEWAKYHAAKAAYERFGRAIEQASYGRFRMDKAEIEKNVAELNQDYMPWFASDIGFDDPWVGLAVSRMP